MSEKVPMKPKYLPSLTLIVQFLAIFLGMTSAAALRAQRVMCLGAQTTIPTPGLQPFAVAVDGADNLVILAGCQVAEVPRAGSGYGAPVAVLVSGLTGPEGVAVDKAGDIFVADTTNNRVVEVPRKGTSY